LLGLGGARILHASEGTTSGNGGTNGKVSDGKSRVSVFITKASDRYAAIAVEEFDEQREIIVKSLGPFGRKIKGVTGAVDLEGGDVALVLDLQSLLLLRSFRL